MRAFYLDTDDTCEEVGITRRQLGYWENAGVFCPEVRGKYTDRDLRMLRVIRQLVVEYGVPITLMRELQQESTQVFNWMDEYARAWRPSDEQA